ncbi:hypothetical protein RZS08_17180, partial [Arthrospira platensis SPKY1]|nr:hypothetical protein [Arthrospira platensis SPKY1]
RNGGPAQQQQQDDEGRTQGTSTGADHRLDRLDHFAPARCDHGHLRSTRDCIGLCKADLARLGRCLCDCRHVRVVAIDEYLCSHSAGNDRVNLGDSDVTPLRIDDIDEHRHDGRRRNSCHHSLLDDGLEGERLETREPDE